MFQWEPLPDDVKYKIYQYLLDLYFLDHKKNTKSCLRMVVFTNPRRMEEIRGDVLLASSSGDHETLRSHLEFGYRPYMDPMDMDNNPFFLSIVHGHYECVRLILEYCSVSPYQDTPVILALSSPDMEILRLLLQRGFNPWGGDSMIILNMIEWGSMFDALQIYVECGVTFSASRLLAMEYSNTLGYLMKKGYDPTIELCQRELGYDFWGSRGRLFRLIFVSCYTIDPYTWHYLSKFMDHDENVNGGGLLEYNTNNKELRELMETLRDSGDSRYDFLWMQE